ncbi:hypothetical protein [Desulfomarina sp.]
MSTSQLKFPALFSRREEYHQDRNKFFSGKKFYIFAGLAAYIIIMLVRSWDNFSAPGLYVEDATHYFNLFYGGHKSLSSIFQHPNGYYNIYNNFIAFLAARADILLQPRIYQSVAVLLCVLTVASVSFSGLFQNRFVLLIAPLLLGLSGLNHIYYYITLTFQMYVVVLLLLVLLLWRWKFPFFINLFFFVLLTILIWSGPYSVLTVPFCLTSLFFFRGRTWTNLGIIAVTVSYALSVEKSTIMLGNLFNTEILTLWFQTLVTQVFLMGMKDSVNTEKIILLLAVFLPLFFILRKERLYLKTTALLFVIIISSFAPLFLSKKYLLYQTIYPCHILTAQFFYLIFILYSADHILKKFSSYEIQIASLFLLSVFAFILLDNIEHREKYSAPVMKSIPAFLRAVKKAESAGLSDRHQNVMIITDGIKKAFRPVAVVGDRSKGSKRVEKIFISSKE